MKKQKVPPAGEMRQSQIVTMFGPGAMVDLPNHSVLIGGLDHWKGPKAAITEDRLVGWLQNKLGTPSLKLYAPPVDTDDPHGPLTGITAFAFPTWYLGQVDETWRAPDGRLYRTRPLIRHSWLQGGKYIDKHRKKRNVVPVRFVQACVRGHISDIDWHAFVRNDFRTERTGELWLDEGGAGNDFAEIFVRCERTGMRRPLSDASVPESRVLGTCSGCRPWLGSHGTREECKEPNRLLTRSASNAYFAQTMSVISIPDPARRLQVAVDELYDPFLMNCEGPFEVKYERKKEQVAAALEGWTDDEVWAEVERRQNGIAPPDKGIKDAEIETLLNQAASMGDDRPDGDFYARTHAVGPLPRVAEGKVERLVLVHRLREVVAQVGFTRFEAKLPTIDGELNLDVETAELSRERTWLPAYENRGEGVFLAFKREAIEAWLKREGVRKRAEQLEAGNAVWNERKGATSDFSGLPYIMLHSLSHLLLTALSLDCGYASSSIRERIYAGESGYGILLYTGTPGAEGTLGGLVDRGRNIGRHLERALELGRLCSNDPVCAQHEPSDALEGRFLHGAACHGCLLIAETSCERRNELLDRALVVPTVDTPDAAFFGEGL